MSFLYQIFIFFFVLFYLPLFFYQYISKGKYKGKLKEKLGLKNFEFKQGSLTIWIHAVSVGEVRAVSTLIKLLRSTYPNACLILSCITETGLNEAKKNLPFVDHTLLLPIDFKWTMRRLLKNLKLDLVLLVETDLWPNFLIECKKRGAKIGIVNGKISERSYLRLKKIPLFSKWYFSKIDFLLVQDAVYQKRFLKLGFLKDSLKIIPNLKLDDSYSELSNEKLEALKAKLGITHNCLTIGSTHEPEEELLLKELFPLLNQKRNLKVLLVPRHPERALVVESKVRKLGLSVSLYSQNGDLKNSQVIVIDRMGFLRSCYQISDLAIVAGSFTPKVGGHNILEPLWYKTPTLFGPFMQTQKELVCLVKKAQAGFQVERETLLSQIEKLIENQIKRHEMGERGKGIFEHISGGSEKSLIFIKKTLAHKEAS